LQKYKEKYLYNNPLYSKVLEEKAIQELIEIEEEC
jgi:hypothetical protein